MITINTLMFAHSCPGKSSFIVSCMGPFSYAATVSQLEYSVIQNYSFNYSIVLLIIIESKTKPNRKVVKNHSIIAKHYIIVIK